MTTNIWSCQHWEDADLVAMARLKGSDGADVTQAALTSIAIHIYDLESGEQVGSTLTPSVSSVIFDSLQTSPPWSADADGYNFRVTLSGSYFPEGSKLYRVEAILTPTTGSPFPVVLDIGTQNLLSS